MNGAIEDLSAADVFDNPEAEPDYIFINPFSCNIDPLLWRELQEMAKSSPDFGAELMRQGVYLPDSAMTYLTPAQLDSVQDILTAMEESLNFELASWLLTDCLTRADRANNRLPVTWR